MRILIATDHFPPFIGGAHRQAQLIARAMTERGHEVAVATPWHGGLPRVEERDGVTVHRVRQLRTLFGFLVRDKRQRHQPPFPDPVTVAGLHGLIADFQPEVIHAYGWLAFSVAVALGRKRIPMLVSARDYGYFCATRTLLRKGEPCSGPAPLKCLACAGEYYGRPKGWLAAAGVAVSKPLLARKMTGLHSVSNYVHDVTVEHMHAPAGMFEVTIPSFQEVPSSEGIDVEGWLARLPSEPFILFVGAFRKVKGLETLFDAYRALDSPPPLVLMGTYERDSPADFPPEVTVLTDVPNAVVMAAWERAMFGVMPSLWPEPLGATVAEGMSRGRPVIGTTPGGHADMLTDSAGILVPQGDVTALHAAMERLIGDPALREEMGRAAAERARSFRAENVLPRFEDAYRSTIAAADGSPG
ncbi:MAG TPA: glycosyltransferase family 4 protein [Solirubrobacterales bacterium]|nr:glycosyltransferase family 4 protein [Solirubrobacterales bacterium]